MDLTFTFTTLTTTRKNTWNLLDQIPQESWTVIPEGFSNHLAWNACHMLVTQNLLTYKLGKQEMPLPAEFVERYRKGSEPLAKFPEEDLKTLTDLWYTSVDQLKKDLEAGAFWEYKTYPTSYGVELSSIEEAIIFNNVHEGLHYGIMRGIAKLL